MSSNCGSLAGPRRCRPAIGSHDPPVRRTSEGQRLCDRHRPPRSGPEPPGWTELDAKAVDTIRHPGTAMSLAPVAYLLFQKIMRHDPADTHWLGRDRSCCPAGTPASRSSSSCIWAASVWSWTTSKPCGRGTPRRRDTPSTAIPRAWRSPRNHWAKESPTRSAWRWRRGASAGCWTRRRPPG